MLKYQRTFILIVVVLVPIVVLMGTFATLAKAVTLDTNSSPAAIITVDTTDDELNTDGDCSLRETIQAANTDSAVDGCVAGSGADTVIVPTGTYSLTIPGVNEVANASGDLDILDDLTLQGAGATSTSMDGCALDRVLHVLGSTVTVDGLTIANGYLTSSDSLLGAGGGILNQDGTLYVNNCVVRENEATSGGGLSNTTENGGITSLIVDHSQILSNTTNAIGASGGGVGIFNHTDENDTQAVLTVSPAWWLVIWQSGLIITRRQWAEVSLRSLRTVRTAR